MNLPVLTHRMYYKPRSNPDRIVARIPKPSGGEERRAFKFTDYQFDPFKAYLSAVEYVETRGKRLWGSYWHPTGKLSRPTGTINPLSDCEGVTHRINRRGDVCYYYWIASWYDEGKLRQRSFRYGMVDGKVIDPESARAQAIYFKLNKNK